MAGARASRQRRNANPAFLLSVRLRVLRLPFFGMAAVLLTAGVVNWLTGQINVAAAVRTSVVEAVGVGVFLAPALFVLGVLWLLAGAGRPGPGALRRLSGILALAACGLGIAGLFDPSWELGGVALERVTAGGNWGDWLTSPLGALAMLALALAGSLQVAPRQTARGLALAGVAGIAAGRLAARRTQAALPALPMRRWPRRRGDPWEEEEPVEVEAIPVVPAVAEETAESDEGEDEGEEWDEEETAEPVPKRRRSEDGWQMPPLDLLRPDPASSRRHDSERKAHIIVETLASFGVDVAVTQINEGPTVTQFGIEPGWDVKTKMVVERDEAGRPLLDEDGRPCEREEEVGRTRVRVNRITRLANDLALALAAPSIRVEAPVPGESVIGFEVPNSEVQRVSLRGVIESAAYQKALNRGGLPIALGRDVAGKPVVVDLTLMPHLLIAGATGSGKSVCINSIIACLLMHFSPEQVRLVLADPKRVELTGYNEVPHLAFSRVVTDPEEVVVVLGIVVREMERRYLLLERAGARDIAGYNAEERSEGPLPYWVLILDELADLMMTAPVEVERQLVRVAQLARATGIHLVISTQRPSVDVVTGLIKANFPTRIAFATTSQTDSRVIMDRAGAERLLGRGDMLFSSTDRLASRRVQGTFVSDDEINALIEYWTHDRFQKLPRATLDSLLTGAMDWQEGEADEENDLVLSDGEEEEERDGFYAEAEALALDHTRVSASMLQRRLRIGYPRAVRLIDQLEAAGVVGPSEGGQSRLVLVAEDVVETR